MDKLRNVENALRVGTVLRGAPHALERVYELCELSSLSALGSVNTAVAPPEPSQIHVTVTAKGEPKISCPIAKSIQIIMFERPKPTRMQYVSLDPISLEIDDKEELMMGGMDAENEKAEIKRKEREAALVEKLKLHTVIKHRPTAKERALPRIVHQINFSWEVQNLLQKNISLIGTRRKRTLSVSERVIEQATTVKDIVLEVIWHVVVTYVWPLIRAGFVLALTGHRVVAEVLLQVLEYRFKPDYAALKDVSATAQQVEIRLQQFCYWPMQYVTLRKRKDDWMSITTSHADYIRFYNSLWLVANDVIIGIALGSAIIDNSEWLAYQISKLLDSYTVTSLQQTLSWLMDWPAGLKLNTELARFLGDLFLWVIDYWSSRYC